MVQLLFSYGTLRLPAVQLAHFGRLLTGAEDRLPHHRIEWLRITDPAVVATSGTESHPILRYSAAAADFVEGTVFEVSDEELAAADLYEVGDYERVLLRLESGLHAWVYAAAADPFAPPPDGRAAS
ncbi:gamma-glutamylcyclotransferase family protein [uncultured Arthrobacter sp.]|uniref:gamma-glutamylcyclotransferase family protein n=1 Tax=uncultured Arthrobacter sp. TaxID=114050 RepID=UPI0025FE5289|nr:gamma-glutamylcyclotransferase family protein [uncultured Arthrobacter sp.]